MTRGVSSGRAPEQLDRVREHGEHGVERFPDASGAAGKVDDQRPSQRTRDGAGERGHRGVREAGGPHQLGEAGSFAIDHSTRGLRRDVPGTEPGPPGRHDEPVRRRQVPERGLDVRPLVRDDAAIRHVEPRRAEELHGHITGLVLARPTGDAVGDRQHGGSGRSHDTSLASPEKTLPAPPRDRVSA